MIFNFHSVFKEKDLNASNVTPTSSTKMVNASVKRLSLLTTMNAYSVKKVSLAVSHAVKTEHVSNVIKVCSSLLIRLNVLQNYVMRKTQRVTVSSVQSEEASNI